MKQKENDMDETLKHAYKVVRTVQSGIDWDSMGFIAHDSNRFSAGCAEDAIKSAISYYAKLDRITRKRKGVVSLICYSTYEKNGCLVSEGIPIEK